MRITNIRPGSLYLTIDGLTHVEAEKIKWAIKQGDLGYLNVIDAEIKSSRIYLSNKGRNVLPKWLDKTKDDLTSIKFVVIPGGKYNVKDIGEVTLKEFSICMYLVTNSVYSEFIKSHGYQQKKYWSQEGKKWLESKKVKAPLSFYYKHLNRPFLPVLGASWYEADAFCRWLTVKSNGVYRYMLPTAKECLVAALNKKVRKYPRREDATPEVSTQAKISEELEIFSALGIDYYDDLRFLYFYSEWTRSKLKELKEVKEVKDFFCDREVQELDNEGNGFEAFKLYKKKKYPIPAIGPFYHNPYHKFYPSIGNIQIGFRCTRISL